ncbi:PREDICTED: LOB domain-containing protein 1-like [Ipomoea nil]|uniref:LOB domain-containing protein 1-like n=1 Tax=Ipomoea nil TaxID=35883 RepID=UPI000900A301|nr:PREDICTED: LOB domain-containing protein 1-like [Ipomoea nil]
MEYTTGDMTAAASSLKTPFSPPSSSAASSPAAVSPTKTRSSSPVSSSVAVVSPCAACKILRRRCVDKCVLAPYFPPTDPLKFTIAHRVFGASNIIKMLQELGEDQRADAVNSIVYEAQARIRDPVYGCAGAICQLQKQISELQAQLAKAQAEIFNMQYQNASLANLICLETAAVAATTTASGIGIQEEQLPYFDNVGSFFLEDNCAALEPMLWTWK